jgi:RNA polymerase sigma-54 factor
MGFSNGFSTRLDTKLNVKVDPRVVLSSRLLQLNSQELEQAIDTELNENPALERLESEVEPLDNATILRSVAPCELRPGSEDSEFRRSLPQDDDAVDWVDLTASAPNLLDHLRGQLLVMLPQRLHLVSEYLIESVNEKGYLTTTLEEAALATNCPLEDAETALDMLKTCEPAGVGASDLQECLLLQLRSATTIEEKLARVIVKSHMDEFLGRKTTKISRKFKVLPDVVEAAFAEILALNPYPGEGFMVAGHSHPSSRHAGVKADVLLHRTETGWYVEVPGLDETSLIINREYEKRHKELGEKAFADKDEKRHIATFVARAQDFISCVQIRKRTMKAIGEYLTQSQGGFISTGSYRFLQPLTRAKLAQELGIHESTVSRATMNKFVQLSNGEIVSFEVFFKPALRVQKMIEEILATENPDFPLSDERIMRLLAEQGVEVARRTVNKYRDRTKMLSSRRRKSA